MALGTNPPKRAKRSKDTARPKPKAKRPSQTPKRGIDTMPRVPEKKGMTTNPPKAKKPRAGTNPPKSGLNPTPRRKAPARPPRGRIPGGGLPENGGKGPARRTPTKGKPAPQLPKGPPRTKAPVGSKPKGPIKGGLPVQPSRASQRNAWNTRLKARVDKYGWKGYQKKFGESARDKKPSWLADGDMPTFGKGPKRPVTKRKAAPARRAAPKRTGSKKPLRGGIF